MITRGGSMFPFIPAGSVLTLQHCPIGELAPGDVVAYIGRAGEPIAHRLVMTVHADPNGHRFLTVAGDRSGIREQVQAEAYIGRAVRVRFRHLTYDPRGLLGQLMSRLALRYRRSHRILSAIARGPSRPQEKVDS